MLECDVRNACEIFERLFQRRLFKRIHRKGINEREIKDINLRNKFLNIDPSECLELEKRISKLDALKCKADHVILNVVTIKNPTYRSPAGRIIEDEIQVLSEKGQAMYLKEIHWSVMNSPNVEDKQQYIEVYAPGDSWANLSTSERNKFMIKLDKAVEKVLYEN